MGRGVAQAKEKYGTEFPEGWGGRGSNQKSPCGGFGEDGGWMFLEAHKFCTLGPFQMSCCCCA